MALGGETRKDTANVEYVLQTGIFEGKVFAVNPSKEELEEMWGTKLEKDIEYVKETKEGDDAVTLSFWLKDVETEQDFNVRFFLADKERENKEGTKSQYINVKGNVTWAASPNDLDEKFIAVEYRKAKVGEEELYNFLRAWLNKLDWNSNTDFLGNKQLWKGNFKELRELLKGEWAGTVTTLAIVKEGEKDGVKKLYQGVYNKAFLPGNAIVYFKTKKKKPNSVEWFIKNVKSDYGCKDIYTLDLLRDHDAEVETKSEAKPEKKVTKSDDSSY